MHDDVDTFGRRLRAARLEAGLTQAQLARGITSTGHVSMLEADKRRPSMEMAQALAWRLGVSADVLLGPGLAEVGRTPASPTLAVVGHKLRASDFPAAEALATHVISQPVGAYRRAEALLLRAQARLAMGLFAVAAADLEIAVNMARHHDHMSLAINIAVELASLRRNHPAV